MNDKFLTIEAKKNLYGILLKISDPTNSEINIMYELSKDSDIQNILSENLKKEKGEKKLKSNNFNLGAPYRYNIESNIEPSNCLHDSCPECNGTGLKVTGNSMCIHYISCNCNKCGIMC